MILAIIGAVVAVGASVLAVVGERVIWLGGSEGVMERSETVSVWRWVIVLIAAGVLSAAVLADRTAGKRPVGWLAAGWMLLVLGIGASLACQRPVGTAIKTGAAVSVTVRMDPAIKRAIATIGDHAWTPIKYTDAIYDENSKTWVSDAEVAEVPYTAFTSRKKAERITGRLVVRRVPWTPSPRTRPTGATRSSNRSTQT